jgi:hypothetical protein
MPQMPIGTALVNEMSQALPLFCYLNKRNVKSLAQQGVELSEKTRLEVTAVRDLLEAGGIMCDIKHTKTGQTLVISVTGLDFIDNGAIDGKITEYKNERIEWLKEEERRDNKLGLDERIKTVYVSRTPVSSHKISRNALCPCGSKKKYKRCCGQSGS